MTLQISCYNFNPQSAGGEGGGGRGQLAHRESKWLYLCKGRVQKKKKKISGIFH